MAPKDDHAAAAAVGPTALGDETPAAAAAAAIEPVSGFAAPYDPERPATAPTSDPPGPRLARAPAASCTGVSKLGGRAPAVATGAPHNECEPTEVDAAAGEGSGEKDTPPPPLSLYSVSGDFGPPPVPAALWSNFQIGDPRVVAAEGTCGGCGSG
jgi:hypothetical protein